MCSVVACSGQVPGQAFPFGVTLDKPRGLQSNDASQILRWGTPGWICILSLLLFSIVDQFIGVWLGEKPVLFMRILETGRDSLGAAILVAGAGVPIGYVLYQIYFYVRWNWWFAASGIWFLHGRVKDIIATINQIPIERLSMNSKWRKDFLQTSHAFSEGQVVDHKRAWYFLESLFIDYSSESEAARALYERSRYLLDILHALGTGMLASICGWLLYVAAAGYLYTSG